MALKELNNMYKKILFDFLSKFSENEPKAKEVIEQEIDDTYIDVFVRLVMRRRRHNNICDKFLIDLKQRIKEIKNIKETYETLIVSPDAYKDIIEFRTTISKFFC